MHEYDTAVSRAVRGFEGAYRPVILKYPIKAGIGVCVSAAIAGFVVSQRASSAAGRGACVNAIINEAHYTE